MKIGVLSDTHNFLDPKIQDLFSGVEHILHGGDIGSGRVALELEEIAPVTAVLGNTDDPGMHFRLTESVTLGGLKFLVHHIVHPRELTHELKERLARERPDVVVFGHTHKPFSEKLGGTLFFNPGYAGKQRFALPRSVAILHVGRGGVRAEFVPL